jgi:RNA polymerase sigma-70 factor (ECF subfamily)
MDDRPNEAENPPDAPPGAGSDGNASPAGEPAATRLDIEQLVAAHHAAIYRYAFRLTGSAADAEDLTQQTFLIAQQRLDQIREPDKADRWLFAVLRSCFLKNRRRRNPVSAANLELEIDHIPQPPGAGQEVDGELLQQVLNELPDEYRLVVVMFYFEQCSYKEIAKQLEIPIGTVMSRLARAKSRLRTRLANRL